MKIRVFDYIEEIDAFIVTPEFEEIADRIGLTEWHPVVWLGRLFCLDNDYGEHWFDNWDLRDDRRDQAEKLNIPLEKIMVIDPDRFKNDLDGPCNPPELRKEFWQNVLASFAIDLEFLFNKARQLNAKSRELEAGYPDFSDSHTLPAEDLEARLDAIRQAYESKSG